MTWPDDYLKKKKYIYIIKMYRSGIRIFYSHGKQTGYSVKSKSEELDAI